MKQFLFVTVAGLITALSHGQNKQETIEGNGKSVTKDVNVSSFNSLQASGVYELRLSQGSKEAVKIEADENLLEYITVRNEGNKLVIGMDKLKNKNFKSKNKMRVLVTFRNLKELDLKTVGNVVSDEQLSFDDISLNTKSVGNIDLSLNAKKMDLDNKNVGNVKLSGQAVEATIKNKGVGSLEAGSLIVQTMNIENDGVGGAEVYAEKDLKVKDSFLGKVKNKGSANVRKMNKVKV